MYKNKINAERPDENPAFRERTTRINRVKNGR